MSINGRWIRVDSAVHTSIEQTCVTGHRQAGASTGDCSNKVERGATLDLVAKSRTPGFIRGLAAMTHVVLVVSPIVSSLSAQWWRQPGAGATLEGSPSPAPNKECLLPPLVETQGSPQVEVL